MIRLLSSFLCCILFNSCLANEVNIAVAANFSEPMRRISVAFEKDTGHKVVLSFGATGKFYAQIKNAAPFDILLSADQSTPTKLVQQQVAVQDTQFTYAFGKLVLWSVKAGLVDRQGHVLTKGNFAHLAVANPQQAPYGAAAMEVLAALKLTTVLSSKIVQGESIGQAYLFVSTGNAELGFVALSQVWDQGRIKSGSAWIVPDNLYSPLRQDAVLLKHGKDNPAAVAFLAYLKSDAAKNTIHSFGYR